MLSSHAMSTEFATPSRSLQLKTAPTPLTPQQQHIHTLLKSVSSIKQQLHTLRQSNTPIKVQHDISRITTPAGDHTADTQYTDDITLPIEQRFENQSKYVKQLQNSLCERNQLIKQQSVALTELETVRSTLVKQYHTLQCQYNNIQTEHSKCNSANTTDNVHQYQQQIEQLQQQLHELSRLHSQQSQQQQHDIERIHTEYNIQLSDLKSQLHLEQQQHANYVQHHEQVVNALQQQLQQLTKQYNIQNEQLTQLTQLLEQQTSICEPVRKSSDTSDTMNNSQLVELYGQRNMLTIRCSALENQIQQLESTIQQLLQERQQYTDTHSDTRSNRSMSFQLASPRSIKTATLADFLQPLPIARLTSVSSPTSTGDDSINQLAQAMYDTLLPEAPLSKTRHKQSNASETASNVTSSDLYVTTSLL